jgi:hypothetical protein
LRAIVPPRVMRTYEGLAGYMRIVGTTSAQRQGGGASGC